MIPSAEESWWIEGASEIERYSRWNREIEIYFSVSSNYIVVLQGKAAKQDVGLQHHQGGIASKEMVSEQWSVPERPSFYRVSHLCEDVLTQVKSRLPHYLIAEMLMQNSKLVLIFMGLQPGE